MARLRFYRRDELSRPWSPADDDRFTVWEALQYLVAALERSESEAADLLHMLGGNGDRARQLAYLLYQKANDQGWAAEANAYNSLITAWPSLREGALAAAARATAPSNSRCCDRRGWAAPQPALNSKGLGHRKRTP